MRTHTHEYPYPRCLQKGLKYPKPNVPTGNYIPCVNVDSGGAGSHTLDEYMYEDGKTLKLGLIYKKTALGATREEHVANVQACAAHFSGTEVVYGENGRKKQVPTTRKKQDPTTRKKSQKQDPTPRKKYDTSNTTGKKRGPYKKRKDTGQKRGPCKKRGPVKLARYIDLT